MSNETLNNLICDLESLPDADQERVFQLVADLKRSKDEAGSGTATQAAGQTLGLSGDILVFRGQVPASQGDWTMEEADLRDQAIASMALGKSAG